MYRLNLLVTTEKPAMAAPACFRFDFATNTKTTATHISTDIATTAIFSLSL